MPVNLLTAQPAIPSHMQRVALGDRVYGIRHTYRARTECWYVDIFDAAGTAIATGLRVSPGYSPIAGLNLDSAPDYDGSALIVTGPDDYGRSDLGGALRLVFVDAEDITPVAVDKGYRVTLA